MLNEYSLWLDDERDKPKDYTIAFRSAWDIICFIDMKFRTDGTLPRRISLDHDLGDEFGSTGYDVICWIEEQYALGRFNDNIELLCHSANPAGRQRIEQVIERCVVKKP